MSALGFDRRSDDLFALSQRSSRGEEVSRNSSKISVRSSTSPLRCSRSSVHAHPASQIHKKSSPSMHDINAEVSVIKPTNNKGRKRRWSTLSPSTDNVCQGNSFSSQDNTERELPPKAKRLARFKSQAAQSSPDIANQRISASGHDLSVAEKQNSSVDVAGTSPLGDSLANHEGSNPPRAIIELCPDVCPGHAEVSAIKPTNKSGRKRRWSPPSPSTDHVCQGNSFSSQDGTKRELPPKAKRLDRFKVRQNQAVQSCPDIANQKISANGHDLSVAEKQSSSVDLSGTFPSGNSVADHEGLDPHSAIIGLCPDICPESERAEGERNEDLDQYERLNGDRKQSSKHLAGPTSCSKHLGHSKESRTIVEDVGQPTSLVVPTPIMHDRLPVTASCHLVEIPSPPSVLIKEEEEHTHTHQEVENCVVVSKQDEEVAEAKLKLILRIWRRLSSKRRQLREEMELALSTALNLLSLGPPIEQNELESNACDREGEIKRDIVVGAPVVESCAPEKLRAPGCRELFVEDKDSKEAASDMGEEKKRRAVEKKEKRSVVGSPFLPHEENSTDYDDAWFIRRREEMRAKAIEAEREAEKKLNKLFEESERVHANLVERFSAFEQDIYIPDLQAYMERHNSCSNTRGDACSVVPRAINEYFAARSVPKRPPVGESKAARALQDIVKSARAEWRPRYYCRDISV